MPFHIVRSIDIAQIDDHWAGHQVTHAHKNERAEDLPFGDDHRERQCCLSPMMNVTAQACGCSMIGVPRSLLIIAIFALICAVEIRLSNAQIDSSDQLERCKSITDQAERLRCYEDAASSLKQPIRPDTSGPGTWRLVRTPNPHGGPDAVSIMQTADLLRSDIGLAGLILRCSDTSFDVLIVLLKPLQPGARPQVELIMQGNAVVFPATVISPGMALVLSNEATVLLNGPWRSAPELALEVDGGDNVIRGVVVLNGLASALSQLMTHCPSN